MNLVSVQDERTISFDNLELDFEPEYSCVWATMIYPGRPCMSTELLSDLSRAQCLIRDAAQQDFAKGKRHRLRYQVLGSGLPGVFNVGGDLARFTDLIRKGDRESLMQYARTCIDILYPSAIGYGLPFTSISLVQGEALGGGFEAALSCKVIIAERGATFGFPETVFGMFPGMGAFSFLARRLSPAIAKRIIASGKVYTAEELYDLGVIDILAPDGQGRRAVYDFIKHQSSRSLGFEGLDRVVDRFNPISYQELIDVIEIWVDTAMQLSEKNLRLMDYLVMAQNRRWIEGPEGEDRKLVVQGAG